MATLRTMQKRQEDIRARVANPEQAFVRCAVLNCDQPTMANQRAGLNGNYCRRHVDHFGRHGSYSKRSYTAAELKPYRKAVLAWLQEHHAHAGIHQAVERMHTLYRRGGRSEEAFRLAGKLPEQRARYVWARLREADTDPLVVLASALSVQLRLRDDPQPERHPEYTHVQMGKLVHRMAGGSHKRWEQERPDGSIAVTSLHKYPASRGRVLRHLGEAMTWAAADIPWPEINQRS